MPRGFSFAKWDGIRSLTTKEEMNQTVRWAAAFQPQQQQPNVFRTLTQTFNGPCAVRVFIKDGSKIHYSVIVNEGDVPVAVGQREILPTGEAFHHFLHVDDKWQSKGYGGRLLCNAVTWYRTLRTPKIHSIKITAGLSAGGSVWPKFGFRPVNAKEWTRTHRKIRLNIQKIPAQAKNEFQQGMKQDLAAYVDNILAEIGPSGIWAISDLDIRDETRNIKIPASDIPGADIYSLGTALLRGTRWKGILDLTLQTAVKRFENCFREKAKKSKQIYSCI